MEDKLAEELLEMVGQKALEKGIPAAQALIEKGIELAPQVSTCVLETFKKELAREKIKENPAPMWVLPVLTTITPTAVKFGASMGSALRPYARALGRATAQCTLVALAEEATKEKDDN